MPTQQIIIEGDRARVVEMAELYSCSVDALVDKLERKPDITYGPLPEGTTFLSLKNNATDLAIVISRKPTIRTFRVDYHGGRYFSEDDRAREPGRTHLREFTVSMPYLHWLFMANITTGTNGSQVLTVTNSWLFATKAPLVDMTQRLYRPPLPNLFGGETICWGSTAPAANIQGLSRLGVLVDQYFGTEFNDDLNTTRPNPWHDYTGWERATLEDPNAWTQLEMSESTRLVDLDITAANPDFDWIIPTPPASFTIARAQEWIATIPERDRRTMLNAIKAWEETTD